MYMESIAPIACFQTTCTTNLLKVNLDYNENTKSELK